MVQILLILKVLFIQHYRILRLKIYSAVLLPALNPAYLFSLGFEPFPHDSTWMTGEADASVVLAEL